MNMSNTHGFCSAPTTNALSAQILTTSIAPQVQSQHITSSPLSKQNTLTKPLPSETSPLESPSRSRPAPITISSSESSPKFQDDAKIAASSPFKLIASGALSNTNQGAFFDGSIFSAINKTGCLFLFISSLFAAFSPLSPLKNEEKQNEAVAYIGSFRQLRLIFKIMNLDTCYANLLTHFE